MYDGLTFHNFSLTYLYIRNKQLSNPILSMEDERILYLKNLYHNEISVEEFKINSAIML